MKKILMFCLLVSLVFVSCNVSNDNVSYDEGEKITVSSDKQLKDKEEASETNKSTDDEQEELIIPARIALENIDMRDYRLSNDFVSDNREKLTNKLSDNSVTIILSDHVVDDMKYLYTPNRNFYYLTGIDRENFILMIVKNKEGVKEYLFANDVLPVDKVTGKMLTMKLAKAYSNIKEVKALDTFYTILNSQIKEDNIKNIYLDLGNSKRDDIPLNYDFNSSQFTNSELLAFNLSNEYENINIRNITKDINKLRSIKSSEEIVYIQNAITLTGSGINAIMKNAEANMMEYQIEAYFNFSLDSRGVKEHAFPTIAASGPNATILHYNNNNRKMKDGELVLFDLGASFGYYSSDISRTIPVNGTFSDRQEELYNIVLKSQLATIEAVKPGVTMMDLDKISRDVMASELMSIGVINNYEDIYRVYPHGISHSLGLETHDPLAYHDVLKPGMIITVEPGLYLEEENIGIRIEDDILVTKDGYINLSKEIIKTVDDIEAYMNK